MNSEIPENVAIIVAHPDDETLWAGGTILSHPSWHLFIVCLCRRSDEQRASRFHRVLELLNAQGIMGDLDDGPDQKPLDEKEVERAILDLLPAYDFDLVISHNPTGEYTKHIRHEEISRAVIMLWNTGKIITRELWTFAYEDNEKKYFPKPIEMAPLYQELPVKIWQKKYNLITKQYGFKKDSWEAKTTPKGEAFWDFTDSVIAVQWLENGGKK
jgi:LmbE family N-acetylglucosaminyl deacetylase